MSNLPAAADTFPSMTRAGMTDLDRLFDSVAALNLMLAGLTATPPELNLNHGLTATAAEVNLLHGSGLAAADLAQLAGVRVVKVAKVALAALDTGGGVLSWPLPAAAFLERLILDITTPATGACSLDAGYTTASAATLADNLIDGIDAHAAAGAFDNYVNAGTNGLAMIRGAVGKWVTVSTASGAAAGLVGFAYIHYALVA